MALATLWEPEAYETQHQFVAHPIVISTETESEI